MIENNQTRNGVTFDFSKQNKRKKEATFFTEFLSYLLIFAVAFLLAKFASNYILFNAVVPTGSMNNTIMQDDRLYGFRLAYTFSSPKTGDVIIFKYPDDESKIYIKRVIGVPGDVVEIKDNAVYVNGNKLDEPYLREPMDDTFDGTTYMVPEDSYFVLGDNRNDSKDSRYWYTTNYVTSDKILAKAIFKYYDGQNNRLSFKLF